MSAAVNRRSEAHSPFLGGKGGVPLPVKILYLYNICIEILSIYITQACVVGCRRLFRAHHNSELIACHKDIVLEESGNLLRCDSLDNLL